MRVKMEQYFQDNRTYVGSCGAAGTSVAPLPDPKNFTYDCSDALGDGLHDHRDRRRGHEPRRLPVHDRPRQRSHDRHDAAVDLAQQGLLGAEEGRIVLNVRRRGLTIVELLVGLTLLAVLVGLGAPAMGTYLQNSKLATRGSELLQRHPDGAHRSHQAQRDHRIRSDRHVARGVRSRQQRVADEQRKELDRAHGVRQRASRSSRRKAGRRGRGYCGIGSDPGRRAPHPRFDSTASARLPGARTQIDISNPSAGACGGPSAADASSSRREARSPPATPPRAAATGDSRACPP